MSGPLSGVRVIDLTNVISGPSATMVLGDQGADIIKVESPNGDFARHVATRRAGFSASFVNNNRNKRSIVLDLKSRNGMKALQELVRKADVFVQNFRPGVMERLGLGYKDLEKLNPRLVYVSIAGFGFDGPMAKRPVYDPLIQALSSLATVQAGSDNERPKLVRTIVPDKLTGVQASQAITAALFSRERTGEGQHVKLSMLDTIIAFLWGSDMGGHTFVGEEDEEERAQSFIDLIYETADGYVTISVMQDKQWQAFCHALEREDLLVDERFTTAEKREVNKDARLEEIQNSVIGLTVEDVLSRLENADVPCAPVLTRTQMRNHPQVIANGIVIETDHEHAGLLRQARAPATFSKTPTAIRRGAPLLGEHTKEVLEEFGLPSSLVNSILSET
jgi:crotonobetainyl-CoA:carnitine CoA-transferase CaiB-like acyl-CoA transferase